MISTIFQSILKYIRVRENQSELLRYIVNGLLATFVHFGLLYCFVEYGLFSLKGTANFFAASIAVVVSFLGSRYFVFSSTEKGITGQAVKFVLLYFSIALVHGAVMWLWSDKFGQDYRVGFLLASCFQVAGSYFGNKFIVFRK